MSEAAEEMDLEEGTPSQDDKPSSPGWASALPSNLRGNEELTSFSKVGDLAEAYLTEKGKASDLEGKLGQAVIKPGEEASEEERAAFFNALGRPESPDKYEFRKASLPEGVSQDDDLLDDFKKVAHDKGLTQQQANDLYGWFNEKVASRHDQIIQQVEATREETLTKLREDWGDNLDGNIEVAKRALFTFANEDAIDFLDKSGLGDNPIIIKLLHSVGQAVLDDKKVSGDLVDLETTVNRHPWTGQAVLSYPSMEKE